MSAKEVSSKEMFYCKKEREFYIYKLCGIQVYLVETSVWWIKGYTIFNGC